MSDSSTYDSLCIVFSEPRLSTYLIATNQDKLEALQLYKLNMRLSESLYSFLCIFELTLRNRISNILVQEFGDNWFEEKAGKWLNGKATTEWQDKNGNTTQRKRLLQQIDKAKEEINKQNKKINNPQYHKLITSDTLTPELNFGFWTEIMGPEYDKIIWLIQKNRYIKDVFPDAPTNLNFAREIQRIRRILYEIRVIRNRVFHHEPVFNTKKLSFDQLLTTYKDAKELLGWLSKDALCFFEENNQFEKLVNSIPSSMQ
ncbi:MAG: Abi family protein [Dolichospermum sp.]